MAINITEQSAVHSVVTYIIYVNNISNPQCHDYQTATLYGINKAVKTSSFTLNQIESKTHF